MTPPGDYQAACAAEPAHVTALIARGILAERAQPGSTAVRETVWQSRLRYWEGAGRARQRAGVGQLALWEEA